MILKKTKAISIVDIYLILFLLFFSLPVLAEVTKPEQVDSENTGQELTQEQAEDEAEDESEAAQMRKISASNYLGYIVEIVGLHWLFRTPKEMNLDSFNLKNILTSLFKNHTLYYGIRINKSRFAFCPGIGFESTCYVFSRYKEANKKVLHSLSQVRKGETSIKNASELVGSGTNIQDEDVGRSTLKVKYLSFLLEFRFNGDPEEAKEKFFIGGGVRFLVRTSATTTINYKEFNESKTYSKSESFNLNKFLGGVQLRAGYKRFGIEGRYIFTSLFMDKEGPGKVKMYPFNVCVFIDLI